MKKIAGSESGSGSISQRHGSADPDPDPDPDLHQNVMDPEHWPLSSCCPLLRKTLLFTGVGQPGGPASGEPGGGGGGRPPLRPPGEPPPPDGAARPHFRPPHQRQPPPAGRAAQSHPRLEIILNCFKQCCGSESGSTGSTCFWASWIWIRIH
jgi:hypothetical protein